MDTPGPPLRNAVRHWSDTPLVWMLFFLGVAVFFLSTLVEGQNWSGDFAQYVHHARNLVEGRPYLDTKYLLNSVGYFVGPYGYPPGFPLLLAPFYRVAGIDLELFKWLGNCCFVVSLWFIARCYRQQLTLTPLLPLLLLVVNPYIWSFRNDVLSDFPFMLICFATLYLMMRHAASDRHAPLARDVVWGLSIGLCCCLAFGTREIGIVLPLTFVAGDIIRRRKLSVTAVVASALFLVMAAAQVRLLSGTLVPDRIQENLNALSHHDSSVYVSHNRFSLDPAALVMRVRGYRWALQELWLLPSGTALGSTPYTVTSGLLFNLTSLLASVGYLRCLARRQTVLEVFVAGYVAVLLLFDAPPTVRYLIPLFPLVLYYAFVAFQWGLDSANRRYARAAMGGYTVLTASMFLVAISTTSYERLEYGVTHPQAQAMFEYVKDNTNADDTLVFLKPRVLALYTQRTTAAPPYPPRDTPEFIDEYFDAIEGDYYVDMNLGEWMLPLEEGEGQPLSSRFTQVFRNTYFIVYRYSPPGRQPPPSSRSRG